MLFRAHMKRQTLYTYAVVLIVIAALLMVIALSYQTISSQNEQLAHYKKQQEDLSGIIRSQYLDDMNAARGAWITANQREYVALQNQGIGVAVDTVVTESFTAVFDLADPSQIKLDPTPGNVDPGEVAVYLGQYYLDNMTQASGWTVSYRVNTTTHTISGFTSSLIQDAVLNYYSTELAPTIYEKLGVVNGSVTGHTHHTIDCSSLDNGNWLDVTEHKYSLKYGSVTPYLLIKTYIDPTDGTVVSVDVSQPYYKSITGTYY